MVGLEIQLGQLESLNELHSYKPEFNGPSNKANTSSCQFEIPSDAASTLHLLELEAGEAGEAGEACEAEALATPAKQRYPVLFSRWQRAKSMGKSGNNNTWPVGCRGNALRRQLFDSVERLPASADRFFLEDEIPLYFMRRSGEPFEQEARKGRPANAWAENEN